MRGAIGTTTCLFSPGWHSSCSCRYNITPHTTSGFFLIVQSLSPVRLFATTWSVACQASLSLTVSQNLLKLMSIESLMPSNHFILCCPSSCLQSFPASGSFQMSHFFALGGQSTGIPASASVLPMNIQD